MKTLTVKMPAFLASALVNGDTSGLECSCGVGPRCGECGQRWPCHVQGHWLQEAGEPIHTGDCDFRWLKAALDYCAPGHVIDVSRDSDGQGLDPHFSRWCELPGWHLGADMVDYVVLYPS